MKFNEFKPQLTEEQIVLAYCKGEITKEDAVSRLREAPNDAVQRRIAARKALQDAAEKAKQNQNQGQWSGQGGRTRPKTPRAAPDPLDAFGGPGPDVTRPKPAAPPPAPPAPKIASAPPPPPMPSSAHPSDDGVGTGDYGGDYSNPAPKISAKDPDDDSGMNTTPAPPTPAPTQRPKGPKVAATAANTRDYDKTLALQKKLIAQGANIKADGLMGPKTMAAMKAAGMATTTPATAGTGMKSTITPGSQVKMPGPEVTHNRAYWQTGMDDADMKEPQPEQPRLFNLPFMPTVDDPKGGEKVNLPFGLGSYETLPQKPDRSDGP